MISAMKPKRKIRQARNLLIDQVQRLRKGVQRDLAYGQHFAITHCVVCGGLGFDAVSMIGETLKRQWRLSSHELDYINRQQGLVCRDCGSNLRSMALANGLMSASNYIGTLTDFVAEADHSSLRVLECNECGMLRPILSKMLGHVAGDYPVVDMTSLPYADGSFDIVVHSDTLEHIERPIDALREVRRVLRPGGFMAMTVPIVLGRVSLPRRGLSRSWHDRYLVETEFGSDVWCYVAEAGFRDVRIRILEYPSAIALVGFRTNS